MSHLGRDYLGTLKLIYERDHGGMDQASHSRSNVNWKCILQVELTQCADEVKDESDRVGKINDFFKVLDLSN